MNIPRRTPDGLNQRALRTQKALFIRIQNRHQRHLWNIQALTQQVNPHQHVKFAQTQIANDFHPLHGVNIRMQIAHFHPVVIQIISQILRHALGQRGDQHTLAQANANANLAQYVVNLRTRRTHLNLRIDQAGRTHDLLSHRIGFLFFIVRRRGRNKHRLAHFAFKLLEFQRAIVQRTRQTKTIIHQIFLARAIAFIHRAQLPHHDV